MAEDKVEVREANWRTLLPWTELFRGFGVALDLNKLVLAALGILTTAIGWWLLSALFSTAYPSTPRDWPGNYTAEYPDRAQAWAQFKRDREQWNVMHEAAGIGGAAAQRYTVADLAQTPEEYDRVSEALKDVDQADRDAVARAIDRLVLEHESQAPNKAQGVGLTEAQGRRYKRYLYQEKPAGLLSTLPWFENRGPNPFLLVTGQAGIPWEAGRFWEWFAGEQAPVMIEPVVKLMRPLVYFFSPRANGFLPRLYFLLILLWTLAVWSFFGGAITRIAAVQVARGEKIGLSEAVRFTTRRLISYVTAPLFPLAFVLLLVLFMIGFGVLHLIPVVGDIFVSGLFWGVMVAFGLAMAIALVGLVSWPLMAATISTEGTDSWEAVSRAYSYLYQRPWHFLWYALVAITYGGLVIFFVGFLGSFAVYLSKWGVGLPAAAVAPSRDPSFLFVYAPTSFGWRPLLLQGTKVGGTNLVADGTVNPVAYDRFLGRGDAANDPDRLSAWNKAGALLVALWLYVLFLLLLGFGYSLFWSEVTIMYMLLRKEVEAAELDEVHLEEEDLDGPFGGYAPPPPPTPQARPSGTPLAVIEPPPPAPVPPPPAVVEPAPPTAPPSPDGDKGPPVV